MRIVGQWLFAIVVLVVGTGSVAIGGDWPMWRHDAGHTASSADELPSRLQPEWVRTFSQREPVWDDPLNQDLMAYDRVFEPIVLGRRVVMGFNDRDKVVALDIDSGRTVWTFYTDGPVRFPAVGARDKVYFVSDDGYLYCVDAADGKLIWRFRGGPSARKVLGNKRVISMWPARGGPVLRDGTIYFAASIWPFMGTFIYALDAETGAVQWVNDGTGAEYIKQPHSAPAFAGIAPQGTLVATSTRLLVPGGRSVPAIFDRRTGRLLCFRLAEGGKGNGGSFVIANDRDYYVHTRRRGVRRFDLASGKKTEVMCNEPVLGTNGVFTATDTTVMAVDRDKHVRWQIAADGSGDLIQAGKRLYAAGDNAITAIALPAGRGQPRVAWSLPVKGTVLRLVAGGGKLLAVTLQGRLLAFGAQGAKTPSVVEEEEKEEKEEKKPQPITAAARPAATVQAVLKRVGIEDGYALCFGIGNGDLLAALAIQSKLHVMAVDPDAEKVAEFRRRLDAAGWHGRRVALHVGDPLTFQAPPYIARLIVVSPELVDKYATPEFLAAMYASLRPYGGTLWLPTMAPTTPGHTAGNGAEGTGTAVDHAAADGSSGDPRARLVAAAAGQNLVPKPRVESVAEGLLVVRPGPLPGAGTWTHVYGNIANTVKSDDRLVKAPLGILWFGGNSNMDVLPRHGHGPPPQILGGRLFIQGVHSVSARDVYTGRVLWKRQFRDLGTYNLFYDATYKNTPLDPSYNQVHIPGANARGTNYVATKAGVYLVIGRKCGLLDKASGKTIRVFDLPPAPSGRSADRWSFLGVYQDVLLGGTGFANYTKRLPGVKYQPSRRHSMAWSPDWFGSLGLVAFDSRSGKVLWQRQARYSFLNNAIVAGNGRIYCLDKLPKTVEEQLARRGRRPPDRYRLLALDAKTGKILWENSKNVFGTWLGYSEKRDILLQAGAAAKDRSQEEVGQGMITYRGKDGSVIWQRPDLTYAGPCILHGDTIIPNTVSNHVPAGMVSLLNGSEIMVSNPLTGQQEPWRYLRSHGCNTAIASEYLITFRSGAAGYYDLTTQSGTGNFGGFRSGCSYSLIAADGVLNAPDYTRTCSCGYQNQTSLALVHMPDVETWTHSLYDQSSRGGWIRRLGLNLGAPGDRRAANGTLWLNCTADGIKAPTFTVTLAGNGLDFFRHHDSVARESKLPWVAASGARNLRKLTIQLRAAGAPGARKDYLVRFHFTEPDALQPGQRVFDVSVQGKKVIDGLDVVREAGKPLRGIVRQVGPVLVKDNLVIEFAPRASGPHGPVLAGIECITKE